MNKSNSQQKKYRKGLPTMIAMAVKCSPRYVKDVLDGKHDERATELVVRIKQKAKDIEDVLTN